MVMSLFLLQVRSGGGRDRPIANSNYIAAKAVIRKHYTPTSIYFSITSTIKIDTEGGADLSVSLHTLYYSFSISLYLSLSAAFFKVPNTRKSF